MNCRFQKFWNIFTLRLHKFCVGKLANKYKSWAGSTLISLSMYIYAGLTRWGYALTISNPQNSEMTCRISQRVKTKMWNLRSCIWLYRRGSRLITIHGTYRMAWGLFQNTRLSGYAL
jgi:hypothetical protein